MFEFKFGMKGIVLAFIILIQRQNEKKRKEKKRKEGNNAKVPTVWMLFSFSTRKWYLLHRRCFLMSLGKLTVRFLMRT
jgi:hypothetical protein